MRRGDIFTVSAGPGYAGDPRPVVVFQEMEIAVDSVIVIPLTSHYAEAPDTRVYPLGSAPIGAVPAPVLREVEQTVLVATGIVAR
jgi:hypothetical protein